ncbi:MAG: transposase [Opitutales bacterium]|nr:transposase [Opitutales bacterium]NRA25742.1 transposase [Opitutales bacterium]
MRSRRIYGWGESVVYHCVTRTVNGEMLFGGSEKEMMRRMLRRIAEFSGVEVLTYAVMSNHVHVLVRVHEAAKAVSDAELIRRFRLLYPKPTEYQMMTIQVLEQALRENSERGQQMREQLKARMGNVSEFMKTLKQRFSIWFNRTRGRFGTLWCERFKSSVIHDCPEVLQVVGAYIELNPVRAGLVEDPKDYRFCGYAEALAGDAVMRAGVCSLVGEACAKNALATYRMVIFGKGAVPKRLGEGWVIPEASFDQVMQEQGQLPLAILLRQRIRFLTDGAVIGSSQFVKSYITAWSQRIGDRRRRKPTSCDEAVLSELHSFRNTRKSENP